MALAAGMVPGLVAVTLAVWAQTALQEGQDGKNEELTPGELNVAKVTTFADTFRIQAAGNLLPSIKAVASREFAAKWNEKFTPFFDEDEDIQWNDFFSSAIIFAGRIESPRAVVVYYNPWSDLAFIIGIDFEGQQILDGFALSGETLRGETLDETMVVPAWMKIQSSLPVALGRTYVKTEQAINQLYPLEAKYELLPKPLGDRVAPLEEELAPVKIRMTGRMEMFKDLLEMEPGSFENQARQQLRKVMEPIRTGDKSAFQSMMSTGQSPAMTENLFRLPPAILARMAPNLFLVRPEGAVAALVSPETPQFFVSVHLVPSATGGVVMDSVEIHQFELLKMLIQ